MRAVSSGDDEAFPVLLEQVPRERLDERSEAGSTAAIVAAAKGRLSMLKSLLDAGASLEARTGRNFTPLTVAIVEGHHDVAKHLVLERRADIDTAVGSPAFTPRQWAKQCGHRELAEMLAAEPLRRSEIDIALAAQAKAHAEREAKKRKPRSGT